MPPLLEVDRLGVTIAGHSLLDEISLALRAGTILAVVGASGSGKTTLLRALAGMFPPGAATRGSIRFEGREMPLQQEAARERAWRRLRGHRIASIPQEPQAALDPRRSVRAHLRECGGEVGQLREVNLDPKRAGEFPFQWSGGMQQRLLIAMALARRPALLLADEPCAALDPLHQAEVLAILRDLCRERRMAALVVTHDLALAAALAEEVVVLSGGTMVESGPPRQIFTQPREPATAALIAAQLPGAFQGGTP